MSMEYEIAHGLSGASDLPIPAVHAVLGASAALVVSFAVLAMAWRTPRYTGAISGRPAPRALATLVDRRGWLVGWRVVGLAFAGFAVWCAAVGPDTTSVNPVFGFGYVLLWVGLVPLSMLFGPVVRTLSPVRTLHAGLSRLLRTDPTDGIVLLPTWVGYWPAAATLLSFTWLELVSETSLTLATLSTWFLGYFIVVLGGALLFGERWCAQADPFEVYSTLVSRLSLWARDDRGRLLLVSPMRNLVHVERGPGLVAVVAVLLGSTAFDSITGSARWLRWSQATESNVELAGTALLLGISLAVALAFVAATAGPTPVTGVDRRDVPTRMAHSVVPIIVGYMVAHYVTYLVEVGQQTLIQASDPLGRGWNLFGTADRQVDIWLSLHPTFLATVKVLAIVVGHVVGVVAAHDRGLALLPERSRITGQLPLLVVMVAYTFGGLWLIFGL